MLSLELHFMYILVILWILRRGSATPVKRYSVHMMAFCLLAPFQTCHFVDHLASLSAFCCLTKIIKVLNIDVFQPLSPECIENIVYSLRSRTDCSYPSVQVLSSSGQSCLFSIFRQQYTLPIAFYLTLNRWISAIIADNSTNTYQRARHCQCFLVHF